MLTGLGLAVLSLVGTAGAAWGSAFRIAGPTTLDVVPAIPAGSPGSSAATAFGAQDEDNPSVSQGFLVRGRNRGGFGGALTLAGAQQPLALAYRGQDLVTLAGTSEAGQTCCSSVLSFGPARGGSPGQRRTLLSGLAGATTARLVPVGSRLLAVVATERGVWAAQSPARSDRFFRVRALTTSRQLPQQMDAVSMGGRQTAVAWSARLDAATSPGPRYLYLSRGTLPGVPGQGRLLLTVASGHSIDEVALAAGRGTPAVAWVESWFDRHGNFHSQVRAADVSAKLRPRTLSSSKEVATGLSFAGNDAGVQVLSWDGCDADGGCGLRAALRPAGRSFGPVRRPAAIDPSDSPVATITGNGHPLIAWIRGGAVLAASGTGSRLGRTRFISRTTTAQDLDLTAAGRGALAVWTQGDPEESVLGSYLSG